MIGAETVYIPAEEQTGADQLSIQLMPGRALHNQARRFGMSGRTVQRRKDAREVREPP